MIPLFDGHCDTLSRCLETGEGFWENTGQLDLRRAGAYRPYAQFFAIYSDCAKPGPEPWARFLAQEAIFRREMKRWGDRVVHCRTADQAQQAARQGRAAAFLSVEGAELLECSLERLEQAWRMGVRAVNLTWNHANALSGSHRDSPEGGLTPCGRAFVRRMKELGVLVDVSHLSDPGFWDVLEETGGPVIATHSNARAVFFHTRNLTDEQFTAIINSQGVVGLNLYPPFLGEKAGLDQIVAHLEHFLDLGGEDCVALGGDWDGVDRLPRGIEDIDGWRLLYDELERRSYPRALLEKIFYFNMMRIVREVCSMSVQEM